MSLFKRGKKKTYHYVKLKCYMNLDTGIFRQLSRSTLRAKLDGGENIVG